MKFSLKKSNFTKVTITLLLAVWVNSFTVSAFAERTYLFKWDDGEGTIMPGWTWSEDISYGQPGWFLNTDGPFGGSVNYSWGPSVRSFEKSDYGNDALAKIDTTSRAPSTTAGGSLKIYDSGFSSRFQSSWWFWYDGQRLEKRGLTDAATDRWSFYIKTTGTTANSLTKSGSVYHVGTYLTDDTACSSYGTGDGTPYEGPGNQHYYHYLYLSPGAWLHVELDRHPTHRRGSHVAGNDPAYILPPDDKCDPVVSHPMHYYQHMNQWYMEIASAQAQETSYSLDEMYFYSTQDATESAESNQNDDSVTSVWVGYWPDTGKWQIGWQDMSYTDADGGHMDDYTNSTFEIRWSTNPITNDNYDSATVVEPEWFSSPEYTSYSNGVRRKNSWWPIIYTQFDLPTETEVNNDKIYFAIKDVSVSGENAGTSWPWSNTDGHNAASPYIHTINYELKAPFNLKIISINIYDRK